MNRHATQPRTGTPASEQPRLVTVTALVEVPQDYDIGRDAETLYEDTLSKVAGTSFGIVTDGPSAAVIALGAAGAYPWLTRPEPLFAPGDQVTYVQALTREVQVHGTILGRAFLTSDAIGDAAYYVYRVQLRGYTGPAGIGSPWPESCLVRGWLEPAADEAATPPAGENQ